MPQIYEIEVNGQTYEVEANSPEQAAAALQSVQAPPASAAGMGRGGIVPGPAGEAAREANVQVGKAILPGMAEGGRQLLGGLKQAGAGLNDFFNAFVYGKPYRGPDVRLPDGAIIRGGDLESSRHKQETANEILRQVNQKQAFIDTNVDPEIAGKVATGTQLGALAIAPEMIGPRAVTMGGAAVRNTVTNAAAAGLQFDADSSKGNDILAGAAMGPVFGIVPSAVPAAKNMIGRALTAAAANPRVKSAYNAARRTLKTTDYSLAQVAQVPQVMALERASYNSDAVEFYAKQTDDIVKDFVHAIGENIPAGKNLGNEFIRTRQGMTGALKAAHTNASKGYDEGMAEAKRLADRVQAPQGPASGPRAPETFTQGVPALPENVVDIRTAKARGPKPTGAQVPVSNFQSQAAAVFEDARRVQPAGGRPLRTDWMRSMESKLAKGHLTVQETADLLKDITALQKMDGPSRAYRFKLREALERDLDLVEQNAGAATDDAVRTMVETRQEYKRAMQTLDAMQDSAAYKLLGVKNDGNLDLTSDQLLGRFKAIGPERQVEVRNFLRDTNHDMLDALRTEAVRDAVRTSQGPLLPAADSRASFEALDDALFDKNKGVFRTAGLWDRAEGEKLNDIRDGLRLVTAERPFLKGPGTQIKSEDVAINLVARHSGFVARQLTRYLMSSKAHVFFTDPNVRAMLMKVNRTTTGTPTNLLARAALLSYLQDNCDESCYEQSAGAEQGK